MKIYQIQFIKQYFVEASSEDKAIELAEEEYGNACDFLHIEIDYGSNIPDIREKGGLF